MKEATGELNMTVVTVVAIAGVMAFFYAFVWPGIQANIEASTYCAMASCSNDCEESGSKLKCKCTATKDDGSEWSGYCSFENGSTGGDGDGTPG